MLVAGGGTGGHVMPSLATAAALASDDVRVEFVGTAAGLEARLVPEAGWTLHTVPAATLPRRKPWLLPQALLRIGRGVALARRLIRDRGARAALCFGGYTAAPLAVAAWLTRIPLVLHEQNARPGVANRVAARWARHVAVAFEAAAAGFPAGKVVVTGNPVRAGFAGAVRAASREAALAHFGLDPGRRTLLVFGGSQGAATLNRAVTGAAALWGAPERLQVLHATGTRTAEETRAAWSAAGLDGATTPRGLNVVVQEFIARMDLAYAAADLAVCRAGASTLAELALSGLPAVLVPYPYAADDHQTDNARSVAGSGGAIVVPDPELTAGRLVAAVEPLLDDDTAREGMAAAMRTLGRPDAAADVARLVLQELPR